MRNRFPFRVEGAVLHVDHPVAPVWFEAGEAPAGGDALDGHTLHLWQWRIDDVDASLRGVLNPDERARADRFRVDGARRQFQAAHAGLRFLLAGYLDRDPARLRFRLNDHGKPLLDATVHDATLRFNLSHSGDWILCGVARRRDIGVDVEVMAERTYRDDVARRNYHTREQEALRQAAPSSDCALFYRFWTLKEAAIKALGVGLYANLASLDFSGTTAEDAGGPLTIENRAWNWCAWLPGEAVAAAVVWEAT